MVKACFMMFDVQRRQQGWLRQLFHRQDSREHGLIQSYREQKEGKLGRLKNSLHQTLVYTLCRTQQWRGELSGFLSASFSETDTILDMVLKFGVGEKQGLSAT